MVGVSLIDMWHNAIWWLDTTPPRNDMQFLQGNCATIVIVYWKMERRRERLIWRRNAKTPAASLLLPPDLNPSNAAVTRNKR